MTWKDKWRFVRKNMKKSKSRIFMTVLATAMGVTFLIVLASVGFGLHDSIIKEQLQDRAVTQMEIAGLETEGAFQLITDKQIEELENIEGMRAVTRRVELQQTPSFQIEDYEGSGSTVVAHFPSEIEAGLELSEGKLPENDHQVIVGHHFAQNLHQANVEPDELYNENGEIKDEYQYSESIVGKEIEMMITQMVDGEEQQHSISLTVSGVAEAPARDWMIDTTVFISEAVLAEVEEFTGTPRGARNDPDYPLPEEETLGYHQVIGYADSLEEVETISDMLKEKNYYVYSVADELSQINVIFTIAKAGLIFIGTIAIIIASIGIYNTMTMAVTERTQDIGIMKAIGAHPKKIKQIFLIESSYIGVLGAIIGTAVAYAISILVNAGIPLIISGAMGEELPEGFQFSAIPWSLVAISTAICLIVTILSGLKPARRATQVDVLKAMRREI
ncbi:ABC transporter permease [Gracilibacillus oryzae]|uniref:ABC transporter permease n=1 Tax=Gracilibacillus oryzae TaxID=1672701 RepID=A0A7C8KW94_9BACI|nr:FtsX-like permease family protein [Gracilibacillus oryzae]KAB8137972.1 ABC transporter permease [Gracilibacillus oryzae]